jgi:hypothetical protein
LVVFGLQQGEARQGWKNAVRGGNFFCLEFGSRGRGEWALSTSPNFGFLLPLQR